MLPLCSKHQGHFFNSEPVNWPVWVPRWDGQVPILLPVVGLGLGLVNVNLVFLFGLDWIFEAASCSVLGWLHTYGKSSPFSL